MSTQTRVFAAASALLGGGAFLLGQFAAEQAWPTYASAGVLGAVTVFAVAIVSATAQAAKGATQ